MGSSGRAPPGLYFMQARYYGPGSGRFLSEDPYGGAPRDPLSLHGSLYCGNGRVGRIDASGMWWDWLRPLRDPEFWFWAVGIVIVVVLLAVNGATLLLITEGLIFGLALTLLPLGARPG